MANYISKHTGQEIDNAIDQVARKITAPENAKDGEYLIYNAETQTWIPHEFLIESEVFVATYNETRYNDIENAVLAGKVVLLYYHIAPAVGDIVQWYVPLKQLMHTQNGNIYAEFCVVESETMTTFRCHSYGSWTTEVVPIGNTSFKPEGKSYLTFSSPNSFTLEVSNHINNWNGALEYFASDKTWTVWDGAATLSSVDNDGEHVLYLRGSGNTKITGTTPEYKWILTGSDIACIGNIENLLDYATVETGQHPGTAYYCYSYMFYDCTALTHAPDLPATILAPGCYSNMFSGCTSLNQAPTLPATTLAESCYNYMFYRCTSLTQAPILPATILADSCYACMFYGCSGLTQAPTLPVTTLAHGCYAMMFCDCTSLIHAPTLPATTLASECYSMMFSGCTGLTKAPELPATTLAEYCYNSMFDSCTSLTQIPALPATTLAESCYNSMFRDCTNLKLSSAKTNEYMQEYCIPSSGSGTTAADALTDMFKSTGGTFTGTPEINTTYYLSSDNMVVHDTEVATLREYVGSMIDGVTPSTLGLDNSTLLKSIKISLPTYAIWESVTFGNNRFVAIAFDSNIAAYSDDGITWTQTTIPTAKWYSVTFGNNRFVAVAAETNIAAYSDDGITWIESTLPTTAYWRSVTFGNNRFVAIADESNNVAYSDDGITWIGSTLPTTTRWSTVTFGNNRFVAVSWGSTIAAYSNDGITWTQTTLPNNYYWTSVTFGNNRFVAIADENNGAAYSDDGITWTITNILSAPRGWSSVIFGNNHFLAIGPGDTAAISDDGTIWTETAALPANKTWQSAAFGNNRFVVIAFDSNAVIYSDDGITWYNTTDVLTYPDNTDIKDRVKSVLGIDQLTPESIGAAVDGYATNIDDHNTNGIFGILNSCEGTFPSSISVNMGVLIHKTLSGAYKEQIYMNRETTKAYRRTYSGSAGWGDWKEICDSSSSILNDKANSDLSNLKMTGLPAFHSSDLPSISHWSDVIYAGDKFVAVTNSTYAAYSTDGIDWTSSVFINNCGGYGLCYGDGKFVSIGYSQSSYSIDGINWIGPNSLPGVRYNSICYGNNKFIIVGNKVAAYSEDGVNWTSITSLSSNNWYSVCYGNGRFVALSSGYITYSDDGITWTTSSTYNSDLNGIWNSSGYFDGKFMALNTDGKIIISIDGVNWEVNATLPSKEWSSIYYGDGKFLAVTGLNKANNEAAYSTDGINWTLTTLPSRQMWSSVCYGCGKFIVVANGGVKCYAYFNSADINPVTNVVLSAKEEVVKVIQDTRADKSLSNISNISKFDWVENTVPFIKWSSIYYGDGKFITINGSNNIKYSLDGINWESSNYTPRKAYKSVCYGNDKFVALNSDTSDEFIYSTNGIDWISSTLPSEYANPKFITYGSDKFVVVMRSVDKSLYSTNGIDWTEVTIPRDYWSSICYGDGKFVAVANVSNKSVYSTDGISWIQTTMPSSADWNSITYGKGKFVAIAKGSGKAAYSTDGINWFETTLPNFRSWASVCYGDDIFVAVANNSDKSAYSTDGINWTEIDLPYANWNSVCYGAGKFVAVSGDINQSDKSVYSTSNEFNKYLDSKISRTIETKQLRNITISTTEPTASDGDVGDIWIVYEA